MEPCQGSQGLGAAFKVRSFLYSQGLLVLSEQMFEVQGEGKAYVIDVGRLLKDKISFSYVMSRLWSPLASTRFIPNRFHVLMHFESSSVPFVGPFNYIRFLKVIQQQSQPRERAVGRTHTDPNHAMALTTLQRSRSSAGRSSDHSSSKPSGLFWSPSTCAGLSLFYHSL